NSLLAANEAQVTRFEKSLEILNRLFDSYDGSDSSFRKIVRDVNRGPRRVAAFNLQASGSVYQKYPVDDSKDLFKESVRFEAKMLEDAIGGVDKWEVNLEKAKKANLKDKIEIAEDELNFAFQILRLVLSGNKSNYLKSPGQWTEDTHKFMHNWQEGKVQSKYNKLSWVQSQPTIGQQMLDDIRSYPWLSYQQDRSYVVSRLIKHLEKLQETPFNFKILEDTETEKGLHEFRREVRWFSFKTSNLNGTVNFFDSLPCQNGYCPSPEMAELLDKDLHPDVVKSRYNKLPKTPFHWERKYVCPISRCLFYKLNKVVSDVGAIKDGVENGNFTNGLGNETPDQAAEAVATIHKDLIDSGAINEVISQLQNCL
ncbi:MAG: hypothetical protein AAF203_10930, partial [Pseudomonadota bacterium]